MPEGFQTEEGPRPHFADLYGSMELPTDCAAANEQYIHESDATLWFGDTTTKEAQTAVLTCQRLGKPCMLIYPTATFAPSHVAAWILEGEFKTLNVAGNCDAEEPGIGDRVERFGQVLEQPDSQDLNRIATHQVQPDVLTCGSRFVSFVKISNRLLFCSLSRHLFSRFGSCVRPDSGSCKKA